MILRRNRSGPPGLHALFDAGTATGLTDGQLLERFATQCGESAEPAFAALVDRHGPMVWRVCRAILDDDHDAEDAFQATFLILVRKSASLWVRDSIGPWLHRVAGRAAVRARVAASRRRSAEREATAMGDRSSSSRVDDESLGLLHAEIDRLPERFRLPVVLCDIEGRTYEDAARQLRCPVGTLKSRLARGRERLKGRLARRGIAGPAALSLAGIERLAVPNPAVRATVRAAVESTSGGVARNGVVSASVASLVREVSMRMFWQSVRSVGGVALMAVVAVVGAGLLVRAAVGPRIAAPAAGRRAVAEQQPALAPAKPLVGVVLGPDDRPVAGAIVVAGDFNDRPNHRIGRTGPDGRFELTPGGDAKKLEFVMAYKEGLAPAGFLRVARDNPGLAEGEARLKLTRTAPFEGVVKDRQGRPIAGAVVRVREVQYPDDGGQSHMINVLDNIVAGTQLERFFRTTSDASGRFVFADLPPGARATLVVTAAGMGEYQTRNRKRLDGGFGQKGTQEAPAEIVMAPAARVAGRVVTGIAGLQVEGLKVAMQGTGAMGIWHETRTDVEGRFAFDGLDEGTANIFLVDHPSDGPWTYRAAGDIALKPAETAEVQIELIRGVQVEGQVVRGESGRPVAGLSVGLYGPIRPSSGSVILIARTDENGRYRFRLPPGEAFFYVFNEIPDVDGQEVMGGQGVSQTATIPGDAREFTVPRIVLGEQEAGG